MTAVIVAPPGVEARYRGAPQAAGQASPVRESGIGDRRPGQSRLTSPVDCLVLRRRLRSFESVGALLEGVPALAREWLGFTRAFVLTIEEGSLRTLGVDEAPDRSAACGWQPGRALMLRPGSAEAELMLATEQGRAVGRGAPSQLVDQLGLGHAALGAIMPEEHVVAFVVSDRPWPEVTQADRDAVQIFSQLVSAAMETLLLRDRMREFTHELRYLTSSANALLTGAIGVPGAAAATVEPGPAASGAPPFAMEPADRISRLFTKREQDVAEQLVAGQSNRAIAEHLHISPDTVKAYVARVMRKLEASNRADAAVRYLRLSDRRADA